jgi:hypothetical protein
MATWETEGGALRELHLHGAIGEFGDKLGSCRKKTTREK